MENLKKWWSLRWVRNLVFAGTLALLYFTGATDWLMVKVIQMQLRAPENHLRAEESQQSLYRYNYQFTDTQGNVHSLSEYAGRPVLINFWAGWCKPCLAEFPSLVKLQSNMPNLTMLFISRQSADDFHGYVNSSNHALSFMLQSGGNPTELDHQAIPATFILNKDGVLIYKHIGSANWSGDHVVEMLGELIGQQ